MPSSSHRDPSDLSDAEWTLLAPLLPPAKPGVRPRKWPFRIICDGIFYLPRSGSQWHLLPREFPPWPTVYHYSRQWRRDGTREHLDMVLRERERPRQGRQAQPSATIRDSQSKARASAVAGATTGRRS